MCCCDLVLLQCRRKVKLERNLRVKQAELERLAGLADPASKEPALRAEIASLASEATLAVRPPGSPWTAPGLP